MNASRKSKARHRGLFSGMSVALALSLAMLVWMKLRLVTGLPRSVYAEPKPAQADPPKGADVRPDSKAQTPIDPGAASGR